MPNVWLVPELGTDFTNDFEDLVIAYIYTKYSITDPSKGTVPQPTPEDEPGTVSFKAGFPDFFRPFEICCVQIKTEPVERFGWKFTFSTGLDIMIRMQRLDRDAIDVDGQLENMEQEVQRIIENYHYNDIPGVKDLFYDPLSFERVYNATDTWAKSDWRSIVRARVFYEKAITAV